MTEHINKPTDDATLEREAYIRYDKLRTYRHPMPDRHPVKMAEIAVCVRVALVQHWGFKP